MDIQACLKGTMESLRFQLLSPVLYKGLQVDITFVKQV
jgi:hypothetical protein